MARSEGTSEFFKRPAASMKNVTDNETVPSTLSEQELQRLAEFFSIVRE